MRPLVKFFELHPRKLRKLTLNVFGAWSKTDSAGPNWVFLFYFIFHYLHIFNSFSMAAVYHNNILSCHLYLYFFLFVSLTSFLSFQQDLRTPTQTKSMNTLRTMTQTTLMMKNMKTSMTHHLLKRHPQKLWFVKVTKSKYPVNHRKKVSITQSNYARF